MARMRSPEITYVDRLQPTSLEWNLFPKVSYTESVEPRTPEPSVPLWLQGARVVLREPNEVPGSTSKCFCPPPPWSHDASSPPRQPSPRQRPDGFGGHEKTREKKERKESEESKEQAKTPGATPAAPSKPSDFRCPDPRADSQDQQSHSPRHPKGVHRVRTASSQRSNTETKSADQAETEDEMSTKRKNILVNEVERIFAIKERKHKFDWIPILGLESGFKERDLDRRKRALLLILHPDKSAKFAKHAGEERLKTAYDFVDVAYLDAKKWLDQKNNGYLPPWERDPFSQAAAQPWQPTRARPAAWTHGTYSASASVSPHPPTTPTTTPTTPTTPRATTPTPRKAAPPPPPENFNKSNKMR